MVSMLCFLSASFTCSLSVFFFSYQDCWKQVNVRKAVLPKLWSVLKDGGSGNATVIFPNLLPFLSKVPSEVCEIKYICITHVLIQTLKFKPIVFH